MAKMPRTISSGKVCVMQDMFHVMPVILQAGDLCEH